MSNAPETVFSNWCLAPLVTFRHYKKMDVLPALARVCLCDVKSCRSLRISIHYACAAPR